MKRLLIAATAALVFSSTTSRADDVNIGILMGFTGPIESLTVGIAGAAR